MKWRSNVSVVAGRVVRVPFMIPRDQEEFHRAAHAGSRLQISKSKMYHRPGRLCVVAEILLPVSVGINRLKKCRYKRIGSLSYSSCSLSATNSLPIPSRNNDQPKSHRPLRPRGPFRPPLHRRRAAAAPSEQQESAPRAGGESSRRVEPTCPFVWSGSCFETHHVLKVHRCLLAQYVMSARSSKDLD